MWSKSMTSNNIFKSKVLLVWLVVFIFTGCTMTREQLRTTDLYDICYSRYATDHALITTDTAQENKKVIDAELRGRGKDCGCYYQAWSPAYLSMGLLGVGLMSGSSGHCENDQPAEVKEITPTTSE
jgi:hypothetical protein